MHMMPVCLLVFALVLVTVSSRHSSFLDDVDMPRIAIIGGGIGGTSAAYQLQRLFGFRLTQLDVYEQNRVGGRLRTIKVNGYEYEVGGSIIHSANQHMVEYTRLLGLKQNSGVDGNFALFKDKEVIFETSKSSFVSTIQMIWRYGMSLFTMKSQTNRLLKDFERIYSWQNDQHAFTTVPNLLLSMSDTIMNDTTVSLKELCRSEGLSQQLVDELAFLAAKVNYGQTPENLPGFVGSVSLAGAGDNLWSVLGGNYRVPEGLLRESGAKLIQSTVTKVTNATSDPNQPLFNVQTSDGKSTEYDLVIIAHPLVKGQSNIEFSGYSTDFTEHRREFHRTIAYIVEGEPNYKYFGYSSLSAMPDDVFPLDKDSFFNSLSEIFPVTQPPVPNQRVYKVFANAGLAEEQLDLLFLSRKSTQAVDWLAYPQYQPNMQLVPFVLAPRLYYVNAIELAASAMEMSAVGGVNVANLATHQLFSNLHLIDNMFIIEEKHIKIEL